MVNPNYREVLGYPCYDSLAALPERVDLVIVTVRASAVAQIIADAAAAGIDNILVYSTGFADAGEAGNENVKRLREAARVHRVLVCGPGSFGFANLRDRVSPFSAGPTGAMPAGNIGVVAQSGGIANILSLAAGERGFGFSYLVASGGELMLSAADYLCHMVEDPETRVLVAVLEEIRNVPRFAAFMARANALGKPVVVLPLGRSEAGQRATAAHSGALAARGEVQEAFLSRCGAIVVSNLDDLIETVVLLSAWNGVAPSTARPLFMTISGGDCSLFLDLASDVGLVAPELGERTRATLAALIPESTMLLNPVDLGTRPLSDPSLLRRAYEVAAGDSAVDLVMTRLFGNVDDVRCAIEGAALSGKRQVMFTRMALSIEPQMLKVAHGTGVPVLQGVDRALGALVRVVGRAAQHQRRLRDVPADNPIDLVAAGIDPETLSAPLTENEALAVLRAGGIATVACRTAATAGEAVAAAEAFGFPVAVKIDSSDIAHKSDIGGVRLNLMSAAGVAAAFRELLAAAACALPAARLRGVLVQPMMHPRLELIFGLIPDHRFGPAVLVGFGGLLAETLGRTEVRIAPISQSEAEDAIERLITARPGRRTDWRGLDIIGAATQFARFSCLGTALAPHVEAVDVNPVGVFGSGEGALALDCLILPRRKAALAMLAPTHIVHN